MARDLFRQNRFKLERNGATAPRWGIFDYQKDRWHLKSDEFLFLRAKCKKLNTAHWTSPAVLAERERRRAILQDTQNHEGLICHGYPPDSLAEARNFRVEILDHITQHRPNIAVSVWPTVRGPWHGLEWTNRFAVTFTLDLMETRPGYTSILPTTIKVYILATDPQPGTKKAVGRIERARRAWDRIRPRLDATAGYIELLKLYRQTRLIPKHIAKAHTTSLKAQWGQDWVGNAEARTFAMRRAVKYVQRYAICPGCGKRGTLTDTIIGWSCHQCRADVEYTPDAWSLTRGGGH